MADKSIIDLQEATSVDSDQTFVPIDNGTQTFKMRLTEVGKNLRTEPTHLGGTVPQTIAAGAQYIVWNGGITFTMPPSPQEGTRFAIKDALGNFSADPCWINPNGSEMIEGLNSPFELAGDFGNWEFYYDGANWSRV